MALTNPSDKQFERDYTAKFIAFGSPDGIPIRYDDDLAALDLGIHVTAGETVTSSRAWFQLKGLRATTLPREAFDRAEHVSYSVKIEHLRAWYQAPEAVYLVLYIEAADLFLAEDVRDIVRRQWGDELLNEAMFKSEQVTTTVRVSKAAEVGKAFWSRLRRHRSMRADGRMFRGRPLGHDLDPLRTSLNPMPPALFGEIVHDLLAEHGYSITYANASTGLTINTKTLTDSGFAVSTKTYDQTTGATISANGSLSGVVGSDSVSLNSASASATFDNASAGTTHTVTASGYTLSGTDAGDYTLTQPTATNVTINPATLTLTGFAASNKTYDGGTTATISANGSLSGVLSGDTVSLNSGSASATFDNANAGTTHTVTASGYTLSGAQASDYTLTQPTATNVTISAEAITIAAGNQTQTYGFGGNSAALGTTGYSITSGALQGSDAISGVTLSTNASKSGSGNYETDAFNGNAPWTLTPSAAVFSSGLSGNYSITYANAATGLTVNAKGLTVTGLTAQNKGYDGTSADTLSGTASLSGKIAGDAVTLGGTASGAFADANAGTGKAVTISGNTISGADANNYSFTQESGQTANITGEAITISANNQTQTYGFGGSSASLGTTGFSITSGTLFGSDAISGVTLSTNASKSNAGDYKADTANSNNPWTLTPSAAVFSSGSSGNYSITYANAATGLTINTKTLTDSGFAVSNKTYDATTAASISANGSLSGAVGGDTVSLNSGSASASFDNANVGTTHTVTASGYTLSGTDAGDYSLTQPTATNVTISPLAVTLSGSRSYDSTSSAAAGILSITNVQGSDTVSLASGSATLAGANHGSESITGAGTLALANNTAGNYTLTGLSGSVTINPLAVTLSGSRSYDSTSSAAAGILSITNVQGSDTVSLASGSANLAGANHGSEAITGAGTLALANNAAGNYTLTGLSGSVTISAEAITIAAGNQTQAYGFGGSSASLGTTGYTITSGALQGSDTISGVTLSTNASKSASNNYNSDAFNSNTPWTLTPSSAVFSSGSASNYSITYANASTGLTVNPLGLTLSGFAVLNKTYDGTTNATISSNGSLSGVVSGDTVTLGSGSASATFDNRNAGTTHTVTASGYTLSGAQAGDYALTQPTASNVHISAEAITIAAGSEAATYGDTLGALTYSVTSGALQTGDSFTGALGVTNGIGGTSLAGTVLKSGNHFDVSGSPFAITQNTLAVNDGNSGNNYAVTYSGNSLALAAKALTDSGFAVSNKIYDGTTNATITADGSLSGVVGGDTVSLNNGSASATFDNKNVGTTHTVTASGYSLSGAQAGDYTLAQPTASNVAIGKAALSVTASDVSMTYADGTTLNGSSGFTTSGLASGDAVSSVTLSTNATSSSSNHWNAGSWSITPSAAAGTGLGNYTITYDTGTLTVNAKPLTVTGVSAAGKVYDATTADTLTTTSAALSGAVSGDSVSLVTSGYAASFANANAGVNKAVTVSGMSLTGSSQNDYILTQPTGLTATITAAPLTVTADSKAKTYGDPDPAFTYTASGLKGSDSAAAVLSGALNRNAGENVGNYTITEGSLASNSNYSLTYDPGILTITTAHIAAVAADNQSMTYGGSVPALSFNYSGLVGGDNSSVFSGSLATTATSHSNVGSYPITLGTLSAGPNYVIDFTGGSLAVGKASLAVTANSGQSKTYGTSDPLLTFSYSGLVGGDTSSVFTGSLGRASGSSVGTYAINQGALSAGGNYTISFTGANFAINAASLIVTASNAGMTYGDGTTLNGSSGFTVSGLATGDAVSSVTLATNATTSPSGNWNAGSWSITPSAAAGTGLGNYTITYDTGTLSIAARPISNSGFAVSNKTYDGTTSATITSNGSLSGVLSGDTVSLNSGSASASFDNANAGSTHTVTGAGYTLSGAQAGDYALTQPTATGVTISKAPLTVTANDASRLYGSADPGFTDTITGFLDGQNSSVVSGSAAHSTPAGDTASSAAGSTYAITPSIGTLSATNYTFTSFVAGTLTVNKAPLTVTANNASRRYDTANPSLTGTITGFRNGEDASVLTDQPTYSTTATLTSPVGFYAITPGGALAANYTFTYDNGTLTVSSATPTTPAIPASVQNAISGFAIVALPDVPPLLPAPAASSPQPASGDEADAPSAELPAETSSVPAAALVSSQSQGRTGTRPNPRPRPTPQLPETDGFFISVTEPLQLEFDLPPRI